MTDTPRRSDTTDSDIILRGAEFLSMLTEIERLRAENARLRGAPEEIADPRPAPPKTCGACRHWHAEGCWRFPPHMVLWEQHNRQPVLYTPFPSRPVVAATERACGEFSHA